MNRQGMNRQDMTTEAFSVVEVLVALTLLCVVMAAIFTIIPLLGGMNRSSQDDIRVTTLAKTYMERVQVLASSLDPADTNTWPDIPTLEGYSCDQRSVTPTAKSKSIMLS
ncbi:MAG: hypothetical protein R2880_06630 [Deinococcales bacterium]